MKSMLAQLMAVLMLIAVTTNSAFSQDINLDEAAGCLVSDVRGKVSYLEKGSAKAKPVTAGTVLPEDATVMVGKKASFSLICDDRSMPVGKAGTYSMAALTKEVQAKGEVSRFAKMAFAAKGFVAPDTTKVRKGWGDKDSILFKIPTVGKIPIQPIVFKWTSLKAGSMYKLIVYQNSKDAPILMVTTAVASFGFDPAQLAIKTGQTCYAQVMLANDSKTASKVVSFTFVSPNEDETALASLMKDKEYMKGSAVQKTLLEAVELESKEFNASANERYQKAINMDAKNTLANQMYAAFLDRVNK